MVPRVPIVCLGEALVDLVSEDRNRPLIEAERFVPHSGGALANVAVAAARAGADVALAGGAGQDAWGRWLVARLESEGVDLSWFELVEGLATPVAFVAFEDGEPAFAVYGEGIAAVVRALEGRLDECLETADALVVGSNTLVGEAERGLTRDAVEIAHERGVPIVFDPNIRAHRWSADDSAVALCREVCTRSTVVRCNFDEAIEIAGLDDVGDLEIAAESMHDLGAETAIVTSGDGPIAVRGAARADLEAPAVEVVSALGAGDAFVGGLVAALAHRGFDPSRVAEAIPAALESAAAACGSWGALD
jgi:fructokinase